jgi:hypothetical protein
MEYWSDGVVERWSGGATFEAYSLGSCSCSNPFLSRKDDAEFGFLLRTRSRARARLGGDEDLTGPGRFKLDAGARMPGFPQSSSTPHEILFRRF